MSKAESFDGTLLCRKILTSEEGNANVEKQFIIKSN